MPIRWGRVSLKSSDQKLCAAVKIFIVYEIDPIKQNVFKTGLQTWFKLYTYRMANYPVFDSCTNVRPKHACHASYRAHETLAVPTTTCKRLFLLLVNVTKHARCALVSEHGDDVIISLMRAILIQHRSQRNSLRFKY